eukprot:gnl/MRDRNA2_/MRDRNA2_112907_c0_seq1.p1 gnl/MRDRNA2_/MRDRNA2_112907_c0~~gnl/MRDRNA2_/MRDRNA2_112907_c0_seq1.p1  ORF type:complete len:362 (+),score=76.46 gnl/MRDRNA2_/MRDRNA2_112907_c0_seq1:73-1158(+)
MFSLSNVIVISLFSFISKARSTGLIDKHTGASEFSKELIGHLLDRAIEWWPRHNVDLDSTALGKTHSGMGFEIAHANAPHSLISLRAARSPMHRSLLPAVHASPVFHTWGEHQTTIDKPGRRQLLAGLGAALAVAVSNIQLAPAQAAPSLITSELQQELEVLKSLVTIVAEAVTTAKAKAKLSAGTIKGLTTKKDQKPSASQLEKVANAEQDVAVKVEVGAVIAETAVAAAAKLETTAEAVAVVAAAGGLVDTAAVTLAIADVQSAAGEARAKLQEVASSLKSAKSYAIATARAAPKIAEQNVAKVTFKDMEGGKNDKRRAAVSVGIVSADKALAAITTAESKIQEAAEKIKSLAAVPGSA